MEDTMASTDDLVAFAAAGLLLFAVLKILSNKSKTTVTYQGYNITPPSNWTDTQQQDYIDVMKAYTDAYLKNPYYMDSPESAAGRETAQIMAAQKNQVATDLAMVPYIEGFDYMAVFGQNYPGM